MYGSEIPNWLGVFLVFRNLHTRTDEDGRARERENERKGKGKRKEGKNIPVYLYLCIPHKASLLLRNFQLPGD
jgi:hypothetical protein